MFHNWFNKTPLETESLLSQSQGSSYGSATTQAIAGLQAEPSSNDSLINQVTRLLQHNNTLIAFKVVRTALELAHERIEDVAKQEYKKISVSELDELMKSFKAVKELLVENNKLFGHALFGEPSIFKAIDNIIFRLNNAIKLLQPAEATKTAVLRSYQNS